MTLTKMCPWCGGGHRKKSIAKRCYLRHSGDHNKWSKKDFGG